MYNPANRIGECKKKNSKKDIEVQLMSFYYINVETIEKWKNLILIFKSEKNYKSSWWASLTQVYKQWKNIQVQLMSFSYKG